jgi:hypothetical protein
MKTFSTGALLSPICDPQQRESQVKEIRNVGKARRMRLNQRFQKMPLLKYRIRPTAPTASSRAARRKEGSGH